MKHSLAPALCFCLCLLAPADDSPKLATVSGIVVKEPGDQPLKKVLLHLIAEDQQQGGNYTTDTDPEGRFGFENVQPGRYRLMLEKTGFHQINARGHRAEGTVLTVQSGQQMNDLFFQMLPSAVITGKVVDEDGEPLPNFGVSLMKRKPGRSHQLDIAGEERTNDLGEYRFSGLFPGQYFLAVVPPPDIRAFARVRESPEQASRPDMSYLPTYYPGTFDGSQASPIEMRAGDEMPVNFTLVPSRSYRIRGIVSGIPPSQKPMVQLISRGVIQSMNAADVSTDGQFELRGVAPGSYYVSVFATSEGQTLSARQPVKVVAGDVEGVKLVPTPPFNVNGNVRFEGFRPKDAGQTSVYLRPDDDSEGTFAMMVGGAVAQPDRIGNFQWTGVMPGRYVAQFNSNDPRLFLKAVLVGRSTATTGFELTGPASVEMIVSSSAGTLEGTVTDGDKPAPGITVVAVPDKKFRDLHERFGIGTTDQNGRFIVRGLAPGIYTVFGWQDLGDSSLQFDPAFLKSQEGSGITVRVEEGSRQKVELTVSPASEEWR